MGQLITLSPAESPARKPGAVSPPPAEPLPNQSKLEVLGKFLFAGEAKFYLRGVTYGPFADETGGSEYHDEKRVERDFAAMAAHGINAIRTYTPPPHWLLDLARRHGLRVLVGLPWEQHVAFLDSTIKRRDIEQRVRDTVRACAGHSAILGYAVGNEIPAAIVRWYGRHAIEHFLERLYWAAKAEDPDSLVTYVNYPSTEYLELPFLDFVAFNVYLETQERLQAYLARLQNLAGDRPLVMTEIGLDSLRHGEDQQAATIGWQTRAVFASGCAGLFIFSWTDEWHRGGQKIEDWKFGLTDATRKPKPALSAVQRAFRDVPFPASSAWPFISVIVCSYNGSRTLRECLEGVRNLKYPSFEVIVVDDGSTDDTSKLASEYHVQLIRIKNGGLSNARNIGWQSAQGEIVAFLDDDASPDPDWLTYLANTFQTTNHAGVGGTNISFPGDGFIARCVDQSPGNPTHVLLTDTEAEHLPGCNMAFRRRYLEKIGGFDAQFRIAGDDVDICWRMQQHGWTLGFNPAAMVWHHRRNSVASYWKQQMNYGKAEALLERKWPEKYNAFGHPTWSGRLYVKTLLPVLNWSQQRIYHGTWGSAPFQSVHDLAPVTFRSALMMPEWYLLMLLLFGVSVIAVIHAPSIYTFLFLFLTIAAPLALSGLNAAGASFRGTRQHRGANLKLFTITMLLHALQPAARLWGRFTDGLTPWRRARLGGWQLPRPRHFAIWNEKNWRGKDQWLELIEQDLRDQASPARRGAGFDRWDLEVRGGMLGVARLLAVTEEHSQGRQMLRLKIWPMGSRVTALAIILSLVVLTITTMLGMAWLEWLLLNLPAGGLAVWTLYECATGMTTLNRAVQNVERGITRKPSHE